MSTMPCADPIRRDPLPDPLAWTTRLVQVVGEARRGARPWRQVYPLLDVPVLAQLWPDRRTRHLGFWRPASLRAQHVAPFAWELAVVVREDLHHRAVAVRVEAAAVGTQGHLGPPGLRLTPLSRLPAHTHPHGLIATAFELA